MVSLPFVANICSEIAARQSNAFDRCAGLRLKEEAGREGMAPLVDAMISGVVEPDNISELFEVNYSRSWLIAAVEELQVLRSFVAVEQERAKADYRELHKRVAVGNDQNFEWRCSFGSVIMPSDL